MEYSLFQVTEPVVWCSYCDLSVCGGIIFVSWFVKQWKALFHSLFPQWKYLYLSDLFKAIINQTFRSANLTESQHLNLSQGTGSAHAIIVRRAVYWWAADCKHKKTSHAWSPGETTEAPRRSKALEKGTFSCATERRDEPLQHRWEMLMVNKDWTDSSYNRKMKGGQPHKVWVSFSMVAQVMHRGIWRTAEDQWSKNQCGHTSRFNPQFLINISYLVPETLCMAFIKCTMKQKNNRIKNCQNNL